MPSSNAMYKSLKAKKIKCSSSSIDTTTTTTSTSAALCPSLTFTACMKHVFYRQRSTLERRKSSKNVVRRRYDNKESTYYRFVNIDVPPLKYNNKCSFDSNNINYDLKDQSYKRDFNEVKNNDFEISKFLIELEDDLNVEQFMHRVNDCHNKSEQQRMISYSANSKNNYPLHKRKKKKPRRNCVGFTGTAKSHVLNASQQQRNFRTTRYKCGAETLSAGSRAGLASAHSRLDSYYNNWVFMDRMQSNSESRFLNCQSNQNNSVKVSRNRQNNKKRNICNNSIAFCMKQLSRTSALLFKAKQRASVLWLLSKAYYNEIPPELRDPFYKDNEEQDRLKPQITQSLANAELYCLALANIYSDPNYHCLNHHGIMQMLMRKGVYMIEPNDGSLTETVLVQTAPLKMSAHMVIIEGIMTLYIKEVLIPEKVAEVVNRFTPLDFPEELPEDPEEAALFWINKSCVKLKQIMQRDLNEDEATRSEPMPSLPMLEDLTDMSDGCCLAALLSFYCPDHLRWNEICLNKDMSMADSIYNLQLVQFFCQEKLPYNICFLSLEDFLYLHETIQPNVLAFIADLLFLFEIRPAKCVQQPYVDYDNDISDKSNDNIHNGSSLSYPELPTPAEMKAKSLQHSAWIDESHATQMEQRNGSTPVRPPRRLSANSKSRRKSSLSYGQSDDDEELTRYFSALDIKVDVDSSPEILMIAERNKTGVRTGPKSIASYSNNRDSRDDQFDQDDHYLSNSQTKNNDNSNNNNTKSYLADYFTQLSNSSPSKKSTPNTTSFAKLNSENSKNLSLNSNQEPAINIAYMQKNDKSVNSEQRITQKPISSLSVAHINKSDSVKELLEQNNVSNTETKVEKQNTNSDNEIASQIYNIRMKLEEKRKKIELERKSAEEQWKSQRQNIGKEAFLRVVHKPGKEDHSNEKIDASDKSLHNDKHFVNNERRESISLNDVVQEVDTLKKKWFHDNASSDDKKLIVANQSNDKLRASIDLMESSITDIDADLERLQEHEQLIQLHSNTITNNLEKTKFYLHSKPDLQNSQQTPQNTPQPQPQQRPPQPPQHQHQPHFQIAEQQSHPQQYHSLSMHQNMQQIAPPMVSQAIPTPTVLPPLQQLPPQQCSMWNDSQIYNPSHEPPQHVGPRRGQWGQPVMPINAGNGINQWKAVPMQPQLPPQLDATFTHSGYEPYNMQPNRQPVNVQTYSQAFHGMVTPNSYNMGGHYASLNPQQTSFAHQNGPPLPPSQYNFQGYSPSQYTPNANVGPNYVQSPHYNPNVSNSNISYNQSVPAMLVNSEQSYHSIPYNTYNNQQMSIAQQQQDKSQQMRPLVTPTLINSQSANNSSVSMTPQCDEYSQQQLSSSPTNKHFIGRTFRVAKPKVLLPEYSAHNSPTRALSEHSNDDMNMNNGKAESSSGSSTTKDISNSGDINYPNESFFISFEKEALKSKPGLKPKQIKQKSQMKREQKLAASLSANNNNENVSHSDSPYLSQNSPKPSSPSNQNSVSPGVGFIIGSELVNPDPSSETEMAKKKELIMLHSLKRRAEQEAKRAKKEQELAHKREEDRRRREDSEKKREEERVKRHLILEQYRQRKAMEEAEKNGSHTSGNSSFHSSKDSSRSNSTLALNRPTRQRVLSGGKPRPKSLHVSASNIQDYSSLDCKPSRIMDDVDASYSNIHSSNCVGSASRPQSSMSQNSMYSRRQLQSPTSHNHSPSHNSALPPGFVMNRHKGPPSDGASDAGSTFSEYTGPKLFVKPSQKSNRVLILNAINVVLAGIVNNETKRKVIEEINGCDSKHYLILFRNAGLQFRAIYSYNPDQEEVLKLHGTGPKNIFNEMIDRFYKYNSGCKSFTEIQTKHLSVTIDAFTIQNNIWVGKKVLPKKDYL